MNKVKLMFGDCIDRMKEIPDGSIDFVVTSPPYDNLRKYNGVCDWNFSVFKKVAHCLKSCLKVGGVIVWIVNDATVNGSETGTSFRQALYFKEIGFNLHDTMIWNKQAFSGVGSLKYRYAPVFDYMFVLSIGFPKTFNPIKDRKNRSYGRVLTGTNKDANGKSRKITCYGDKIAEFGQRFNIWENSAEMNRNIKHPAPFPVKLISDQIVSWSSVMDTVLDPFMGSGTTGVAALNTNRKFIGIEKDKNYFNIAKKRIIEVLKT